MAKENNAPMLTMSAPPYWHCGRTILRRSLDQVIALIPAVLMAIWNWGLPAVRVMALSIAVCVAVEAISCHVMKRAQTVHNFSAVVTGILFAFLLPAGAPWWLVALGASCAMLFGKMLFGGLGDNPVSAPVMGWAILFVSFPFLMDANVMNLTTDYADPLFILRNFGVERASEFSLVDLLLGKQISALGAGQVGALILGGIYLLARGVARPTIVAGVLVGVLAPFAYMQMTSDASISAFFHLGTGSVVLCAFFIATESSIAPVLPIGQILYGLTIGLLIFAIRTYGSYADGAPFAVLLVSLLTPYFDLIRPKPFGVR